MGGCQTPEQKVEKLIRQLRDDGISVHEQSPALSAQLKRKRNAAILKLGKDIQISAVPALIQLLQDQKASIRRNAASALGQIGPEAKDAVSALIQSLQDQDEWVRSNTAWALGMIGIPVAIKAVEGEVPVLIKALQDQEASKSVHVMAAWTLGNIGEGAVDAVPALMQALKDQNPDVRNNAAWALAKIGEDAVPALIQALQDQDSQVHANAVLALGEIGTPEALKAV